MTRLEVGTSLTSSDLVGYPDAGGRLICIAGDGKRCRAPRGGDRILLAAPYVEGGTREDHIVCFSVYSTKQKHHLEIHASAFHECQ